LAGLRRGKKSDPAGTRPHDVGLFLMILADCSGVNLPPPHLPLHASFTASPARVSTLRVLFLLCFLLPLLPSPYSKIERALLDISWTNVLHVNTPDRTLTVKHALLISSRNNGTPPSRVALPGSPLFSLTTARHASRRATQLPE